MTRDEKTQARGRSEGRNGRKGSKKLMEEMSGSLKEFGAQSAVGIARHEYLNGLWPVG